MGRQVKIRKTLSVPYLMPKLFGYEGDDYEIANHIVTYELINL